DGADQGAVHAAGGLELAALEQGAAHPVAQLGGGLRGEGGGDQLGRVQAAGDPLRDLVGEGVRLAGAGRRVDQGEGGAHRQSPFSPLSEACSLLAQWFSTSTEPAARAASRAFAVARRRASQPASGVSPVVSSSPRQPTRTVPEATSSSVAVIASRI